MALIRNRQRKKKTKKGGKRKKTLKTGKRGVHSIEKKHREKK